MNDWDKTIRISIDSDPEVLGSVRALVRKYMTSAGLSDERADSVVLAVDEACTNSIRHAYKGKTTESMTLRLRRSADGIEIEVEDQGEPAPPEKFRNKPFSEPDPETIQPGGLGIPLMHSVFDEVQFTPGAEKGNRITMLIKQSDQQKDMNDRIAADKAR